MDSQPYNPEGAAAEFAFEKFELSYGVEEAFRGNLHLIYNWIGKEEVAIIGDKALRVLVRLGS